MGCVVDEHKDLTIILPTYNEAGNIQPMLETLSSLYPGASIIVADDNSKDNTQEDVLDFADSHPLTRLISRDPADRGLTASIMDGIVNTKTAHFVVMDADFQHPPGSVGDLHVKLRAGAEIVVGVREDKTKLSVGRMLASWGAHMMAQAYLKTMRRPSSQDTMSGLFGGQTKLCQGIIEEKGHKFERAGFKVLFDLLKFLPHSTEVIEVQFVFNTRRSGESKLSSRVILSILRQCGFVGKITALAVQFMLINMVGRFLSALSLGLLFTFWIMGIQHIVYDDHMVTSTVLAFILAMSYLVIANKYMLTHGRRDGLVLGAKLVFTAFSGYMVNLYIFYMAFSAPLSVQTLPMFLGFGVAYMWNTLSSAIPEN
ncbi:MAG TPA: glycosyltransferase [Methanomassiliicoccales archaeon]|nr:glycosyltransferase [Methanomassiliicoccales archaeon]